MSHTCPYNGKHRFPTQSDAVRAARRMNNQHKGLPSVYFCTHCNSWHLTHYSYRDGKYIREYQRQQKQERKKQKTEEPMQIILDTQTHLCVSVDFPKTQGPNGGGIDYDNLRLAIVDPTGEQKPVAVTLSLHQVLEVKEAIQIQLQKMIK